MCVHRESSFFSFMIGVMLRQAGLQRVLRLNHLKLSGLPSVLVSRDNLQKSALKIADGNTKVGSLKDLWYVRINSTRMLLIS